MLNDNSFDISVILFSRLAPKTSGHTHDHKTARSITST